MYTGSNFFLQLLMGSLYVLQLFSVIGRLSEHYHWNRYCSTTALCLRKRQTDILLAGDKWIVAVNVALDDYLNFKL